ncbi:MAG TPA: GNAT family protein [Burkholderiales bacterium]|nr:GNAT family protein [Burkholderiales bacterium]
MTVELRPLDAAAAGAAAAWLAAEENAKWLDFGRGVRSPGELALRLMAQHSLHALRVYAAAGGPPIGIVALSDIDRAFGSATLWYVLGDKREAGRGCTTLAAQALLRHAFDELGLRSVQAWAVATNRPSIRVLEKCHFRLIGRRRQCHVVDGAVCDRLLFDVLRGELAAGGDYRASSRTSHVWA